MGLASLGGIRLRIDPDSVDWTYQMKVVDFKSMGGKVIQVLGVDLGEMTVTGMFGQGNRRKGDTGGWQEAERFRQQVKAWTRASETELKPIRFVYPPRRWDFNVYIANFGGVRLDNVTPNMRWSLRLFVSEDRSRTVVTGIKDLYLKRLMEGVGWKQTNYNGGDQAQVDEILNGGSYSEYLLGQANAIALASLNGNGGGS